uniref:Uncharacterized protein n=1 Tax=Arundo donax TaxID=35708 RepID=A0A0A9B2G8_ARUDO
MSLRSTSRRHTYLLLCPRRLTTPFCKKSVSMLKVGPDLVEVSRSYVMPLLDHGCLMQ